MSFLKTLGQVMNASKGLIGIGTNLIPVVGPIISALIPKAAPGVQNVADELPEIAKVIAQTEALGQALGADGPKKLTAAIPLVASIILKSPISAGKRIKDQELFMRGITKTSDGMADILNSFDDDVIVDIKATVIK